MVWYQRVEASNGTMFEYDIAGGLFSKIHDFQSSGSGKTPNGSLRESSNGHLYGMTGGGTDASYYGTLVQIDISTLVVTKKLDYTFSNGSKPIYTQLESIVINARWTGAVSTDWHNPANWSVNAIPGASTEVRIPDVSAASGNSPVVSNDACIRSLILEDDAYIDILSGVTFRVVR